MTSQTASPIYVDHVYDRDQKRIGDRFLTFLMWVLLGYAVGARGFAYLGVYPVYIGEITLAFGLLALAYSRSLGNVFYLNPARWLLLLMAWCLLCTLPYLPRYGMDAARDAMAYGYAVFAFITAAILIDRPERLRILLIRYRGFALFYLAVMWILFLLNRTGLLQLPSLPGAPVEIISTDAAPILVHVAGATAYVLVGLVRSNPIVYMLIGLEFFVLATVKRSGMLAFAAAILVVVALKTPNMKIGRLAGGVFAILLLVALASPFAHITTKSRNISVEQLWTNVRSMATDEEFEGVNVDETTEWRLQWWGAIIGYTIKGEYFWTGKGFGINLAEDDGFLTQQSVQRGAPTRNPHSSHLMMLARAGVPGLLLWLIVQLSWAWVVLRACLESRRARDYAWSGIFVFLLAYWAAFLVDGSFNLSIESPYQGIWFWVLFGAGIAAVHIYRTRPEIAWDEPGAFRHVREDG